MATTKYSISAANRITGKSRTTILKHIRQGKLSCEIDADGKRVLDQSELLRVYGSDCDFEREQGGQSSSNGNREQSKADQSIEQQLRSVQLQLDTLTKERERERSQLQHQIEHLQDSLKQSQENASKAMLLLEHRSGGGDLQETLKSLERRIANQESTLKERLAYVKAEGQREAIEEIKRKSWLSALVHIIASDFRKPATTRD